MARVNVHTMANGEIERWKLARLRGRVDLGYLCREVLGYKDVSDEYHAPVLGILQKFKKPSPQQFTDNDNLDKKGNWNYKPVCPMTDLTGKRRRLILDPRGHLKTTINAQAHTIQWILNYPEAAIQVVQSNGEKAEAILREVKNHFMHNPTFRELYPDYVPHKRIEDFGSASQFTTPARPREVVRREPTMMVGSIDKGSAGYHFDVMKFSDIVEPNNVKTPEQIQAVISSFWLAENLLVAPHYWIDVEGTRYDFSDLYGRIIEMWEEDRKEGRPDTWDISIRSCWRRDYKGKTPFYTPDSLELPYLLEEGKKVPIWPRFRAEDFERMERQDGYVFSCQQCNNPSIGDSSSVIFPVDKMNPKFIDREVFKRNIPLAFREITVDTAETITDRADFTVLTVGSWSGNNRLYIEEIIRGKFMPDEIVRHLITLYRKYHTRMTPIQKIKIEETGFVRGLRGSIEREADKYKLVLPITFLKRETRESKRDRIIKTLQPFYKNGEIIFLDDLNCREALIAELSKFPLYKHDDILDTLSDMYQDKEEFGRLIARKTPQRQIDEAMERLVFGEPLEAGSGSLVPDDFKRIGWY
jgi:predicted phage terminase large subunit-like protein